MAASPPLTPQSNHLPTFSDSHGPAAAAAAARDQCVASALARFEYEAGHTSVATATKVLLIEWEAGTNARGRSGQWTVEWKGGKKQILVAEESGRTPADADADYGEIRDQPSDQVPTLRSRSESLPPSDKPTHRLYFILPAGIAVPPHVAICFIPDSQVTAPPDEELKVMIPTLPAIFPPSLLTTGTAQGKKGVLHTLWAKSRLHALRAEMVKEESGLPTSGKFEAAQTEFEWICDNFGIGEQYGTAQAHRGDGTGEEPAASLSSPASLSPSASSPYPATPVSPGGSERFLSKMRGLRVGTSGSSVLSAAQLQQPTPPQTDSSNLAGRNPLSPEAGDVAVGSFAAIKGLRDGAEESGPGVTTAKGRSAVPIAPPSTIRAQQQSGFEGMASLGGLSSTAARPGPAAAPQSTAAGVDGQDDELFAMPISPRSPDMAKSPFSWDKQDVTRAAAAAVAAGR